jgi:glucan phosphoethanolaminetransferase (alkaline phosphatase superfamily)
MSSQISNLTATVTTVLSSVVASFIAVEALLAISNQLVVWIGFVAVVYAYILGGQQALQRSYLAWQAQHREPDEDRLVGIKILSFLNIAVVIVFINLVMRGGREVMTTTEMEWDDYIALMLFGMLVVFVFFQRAQSIFLPQKKGVPQF